MKALLWVLTAAVIMTTALPFTNSVTWWVRMWDFPRVHIAIVALIVLILGAFLVHRFKLWLIGLMAVAFTVQAVQIFPYTPLAQKEIELRQPASNADRVHMLAINVLMENSRHADLISIIEREDPDVLLLMETDQVWADALAPVLARYPTTKMHIADDHYGMIFATRLDTTNVDLVWLVDDSTPSVKATLRAPNGSEFNFIGLHPRPPVPGNDTEARDQQIKDAARMTASSKLPTICMGDFNDVTWSWTTRRFKRYGDFVEPRVGRGMLSSFHADNPILRFPIDQLFLTKDVNLMSFARLEAFGSDHFPIVASVFFD